MTSIFKGPFRLDSIPLEISSLDALGAVDARTEAQSEIIRAIDINGDWKIDRGEIDNAYSWSTLFDKDERALIGRYGSLLLRGEVDIKSVDLPDLTKQTRFVPDEGSESYNASVPVGELAPHHRALASRALRALGSSAEHISIRDLQRLGLSKTTPFLRDFESLRRTIASRQGETAESRPGTLIVPEPGTRNHTLVQAEGMELFVAERVSVRDSGQTEFEAFSSPRLVLRVPEGYQVAFTPIGQSADRHGQKLRSDVKDPGDHPLHIYSQVDGETGLVLELWKDGERQLARAAKIPKLEDQSVTLDFSYAQQPQLEDGESLVRRTERHISERGHTTEEGHWERASE